MVSVLPAKLPAEYYSPKYGRTSPKNVSNRSSEGFAYVCDSAVWLAAQCAAAVFLALDPTGCGELYGLRKQTVEPVFGIIKHAMRFRQFLLRAKCKVSGEWQLVALSYNLRRMANLAAAA